MNGSFLENCKCWISPSRLLIALTINVIHIISFKFTMRKHMRPFRPWIITMTSLCASWRLEQHQRLHWKCFHVITLKILFSSDVRQFIGKRCDAPCWWRVFTTCNVNVTASFLISAFYMIYYVVLNIYLQTFFKKSLFTKSLANRIKVFCALYILHFPFSSHWN